MSRVYTDSGPRQRANAAGTGWRLTAPSQPCPTTPSLRPLALVLAAAACLTAAASGAQSFVDVTGSAGVANAGQYSTGLAWGDYDGDGDVDVYVTNWGTAQQVPPNRNHEQNSGYQQDRCNGRIVEKAKGLQALLA